MWSNILESSEAEKCHMDMETLGITEYPFSESLLKVQYQKKCFQFHPDVSQKETEEEMKRVNAAYTSLKLFSKKDYNETTVRKSEVVDPDIFKLFESCKKCVGRGYIIREVPSIESCPNCRPEFTRNWWFSLFSFSEGRGQGYHQNKCTSCFGKGLTHSGKECNRCAGTGHIKIVCETCNGKGVKRNKEIYIKETCLNCHGLGKIEIKPFNPVIPKGAVLNGK